MIDSRDMWSNDLMMNIYIFSTGWETPESKKLVQKNQTDSSFSIIEYYQFPFNLLLAWNV